VSLPFRNLSDGEKCFFILCVFLRSTRRAFGLLFFGKSDKLPLAFGEVGQWS